MANKYNKVEVAEDKIKRELTPEEKILLDLIRAINDKGGVEEHGPEFLPVENLKWSELGDVVVQAADLLIENEIPFTLEGYTDDVEDQEDEFLEDFHMQIVDDEDD